MGLERYLVGPPPLRKVWLGLVALLCYLTVRLFLAFLHQIPRSVTRVPRHSGGLPHRLGRDCQRSDEFSRYSFISRSRAEPEAEAAFAKWALVGGCLDLTDPESPIHWFGKSDAIWVSLPGVSAISQQAARDQRIRLAQIDPSNGGAVSRLSIEEKELARRRLEYLVSLLRDAQAGRAHQRPGPDGALFMDFGLRAFAAD